MPPFCLPLLCVQDNPKIRALCYPSLRADFEMIESYKVHLIKLAAHLVETTRTSKCHVMEFDVWFSIEEVCQKRFSRRRVAESACIHTPIALSLSLSLSLLSHTHTHTHTHNCCSMTVASVLLCHAK